MINIYGSNTLVYMKDTTVRPNKYLPKFVPIVSILLIACVSIIGCLRTILFQRRKIPTCRLPLHIQHHTYNFAPVHNPIFSNPGCPS